MILHWPQITIIALLSGGFAVSMIKHNEYKGRYNFWVTGFASSIEVWILYSGGFFTQAI